MVCKLYICDIGAIQTKVNDHCLDIAAALNDEQCLTLHLNSGESGKKTSESFDEC